MPLFTLYTNVPKAKVSANLLKELSQMMAELVGKPEQYVMVHVIPDQLMIWGGTDAPCGKATIASIGRIGKEENIKYSRAFYEKINKELGIPPDRMYIEFVDMTRENTGYNGTTFAAL